MRDDERVAVEQVLGLFGVARQERDCKELKPCFAEKCNLRNAVGSEELAALGQEVRGFALSNAGDGAEWLISDGVLAEVDLLVDDPIARCVAAPTRFGYS